MKKLVAVLCGLGAMSLYFQSIQLALSLLCVCFALFWRGKSLQTVPAGGWGDPPTWWFGLYVLPVLLAWFACFALLGFAINNYFGGLILAFEAGVFITGWIFT